MRLGEVFRPFLKKSLAWHILYPASLFRSAKRETLKWFFHPFHCTKFSHECSPTFKTTSRPKARRKRKTQVNNHSFTFKNPQSAIKEFRSNSKVSHLNKGFESVLCLSLVHIVTQINLYFFFISISTR